MKKSEDPTTSAHGQNRREDKKKIDSDERMSFWTFEQDEKKISWGVASFKNKENLYQMERVLSHETQVESCKSR